MQHRKTITIPNPDLWAEHIHRSNVAQEVSKRRLDAEAIRELGEVKYELPKEIYPKQRSIGWFEFLTNINYSRLIKALLP